MSDPFAPSDDPDIPTPTRDDLINHVYGPERAPLLAGSLPASVAETLLADARRKWDEGHKQEAERQRATGEAKPPEVKEIGLPLAGRELEGPPDVDSEIPGTFGDIKPLNDTTTGTRVPGQRADRDNKPIRSEAPDPSPLELREADRILRLKTERESHMQAQPIAAKTEASELPPELPPRWLNRFRWFRWLRARPAVRRASGGGGVVLSALIAKQALDYEINGAWKTAALVFLAAWGVLAFAIYVSNVWDKRRPFMSTVSVLAGVFLAVVWWGYLPTPAQQGTAVLPAPTRPSRAGEIIDERQRRLTEEQKKQLVAILSQHHYESYVVRIRYNVVDLEAGQFVTDFADVFRMAGWHVEREPAHTEKTTEYPKGLTVAARWNEISPPQATILADALQQIGLKVRLIKTNRLIREDDVALIVGANLE